MTKAEIRKRMAEIEDTLDERYYLCGTGDRICKELMIEYQKHLKTIQSIEERENMVDALVSHLGHENSDVIYFCTLCEELEHTESAQAIIKVHYEKLLNKNIWED